MRYCNVLAQMGKILARSVDELIVIVDIPNAFENLNVFHELGLPVERRCEIAPDHPRFRMIWRKTREWLVPPEGGS